MSTTSDWEIPAHAQPKQEDWTFDLDRTLDPVLTLRAAIPADAFTAGTLGTERGGNAVVIRADGLVLTIGYLITEADTIWLNTNDGRAVPGHVLGYDQETGFGLVQALGKLNIPPMPLGPLGPRPGRRPRHRRRRRRTPARRHGAHRGQAGIRRILGIPARRGDLHQPGAPQLGRRRAHRERRHARRDRLAPSAAGARAWAARAPQHDRADRSPAADPRGSD